MLRDHCYRLDFVFSSKYIDDGAVVFLTDLIPGVHLLVPVHTIYINIP